MKTITRTATLFNGQGYIESHGVTVIDHGDTISIGRSEYLKSELQITPDKIVSKTARRPHKHCHPEPHQAPPQRPN